MGSLHGETGCNILAAFVLAALLAVPLLAAIRGSMAKFMRRRQSARYTPPLAPQRADAPPLDIARAEHRDTPVSAEGRVLAARARAARRAAMAVYFLAGLACAALLAYADLRISGPEARTKKFVVLLAIHVWPVMLATAMLSAAPRRTRMLLPAVAAAVLFLFTTIVTRSPAPWLIYAGPPTLLLLATANRHFRTIAPIIVIFAFIAAVAANRAMSFVRELPDSTACGSIAIAGLIVFVIARHRARSRRPPSHERLLLLRRHVEADVHASARALVRRDGRPRRIHGAERRRRVRAGPAPGAQTARFVRARHRRHDRLRAPP